MYSTTIVVPCSNEAERFDLPRYRRFAANQHALRFLFVNDGSQDGTPEILARLQRDDPNRFDLLDLDINSGKAEAVRQGLLAALQTGAELVGYWDADLSTPLEAIPVFRFVMQRRPEIDVVIGSRIPLLGRSIEHRFGSAFCRRLLARAASFVLGMGIFDSQCGAKLFRASAELHAVLSQPFRARQMFDVEILARLINVRRGTELPPLSNVIYEQPLEQWDDAARERINPADLFRVAGELAAIYWQCLRPGAATLQLSPAILKDSENAARKRAA